MKVVIVGGAGFIGVNAAHMYALDGDEVTVIDNFSRSGSQVNADWLQSAHPSVKVVHADIRSDHDILREQFRKADTVIHEAAQVAVTTSVRDPRSDFEINALGTFNVLEALRAVYDRQIVLFASTNKVYGGLEHHKVVMRGNRYEFESLPRGVSEDENLDFHSPYGCSKGAAEQYVRDYARIYGLRTVVFRQSCIYGPHQFGVEDQGWVAWFSIRASQRCPVTIYGDGKQVRDILFVDDLVDAYKLACDRIETTSGQIYNLGGGPSRTLSLLELVEFLRERYGDSTELGFSEWRPGDQRVFVASVDKAQRDFGWVPATSNSSGLSRLCDWIDANPSAFAVESPSLAKTS